MREKTKSPQDEYLETQFGLPDQDLKRIEDEMRLQRCEGMALATPELRILQFLIKVSGAKNILEIGTLFGRSSIAMARALPPDGKLTTIEKSEVNYKIATGFIESSPERQKIRLLNGEAKEILQKIEAEGPYDFVLIDADKAGYVEYLNWAEKNLKAGGIIVGDNSFLWGGVWDKPERDVKAETARIMKEFNSRLSDSKNYTSMLVPTVEGMTVAQRIKKP